jgi:hypothetical protein
VRDVVEQVLRVHSNWYVSDTNIQSI